MTLKTLESVLVQLEHQYLSVLGGITEEKPAMQHCNLIEVCGAIQLAKQLIQQEQIELHAPPGATGPGL